MASSSQKVRKVTFAQIMFLVAGLFLLIKYLLENTPSTSDLFQFIVSIFVLIVLVGFYVLFVFGLPGFNSPWKALAPSVLILAVCGEYSLNFGNADVNSILSGIGSMLWILILVSIFVFVFLPKKWLGMTGGIASIVYGAFVVVSYIVMTIIGLVNDGKFDLNQFFKAILLAAGLILIGTGLIIGLKRRDWIK